MALTADLSSSGVTVKKEKEDQDKRPPAAAAARPAVPEDPSPPAAVQTSSSSSSAAAAPPPAIDFASTCGAFGWTTIGSVHLPFIMRGEDRFIAVRMVECKIISSYADLLPWTVFTCTNIKSYYVTENEARLLNEINGFHCDFQFGCQPFTPKDVVVRLKDTIRFYEFLETCKGKLGIPGANPIFGDQCGFFVVRYAPVPFVKRGGRKYVPLAMLYPSAPPPPPDGVADATEWDLAYLRFLCSVANLDSRKLSCDARLCPAADLQGAPFEEWWPNVQYSSSKSENHSSSNSALPKWGESVPDATKKLRERMNEIRDKESALNQFFGKFAPKAPPGNHHHHASVQNGAEKAAFHGTLENFLATSSCSYPYPVNYRHHQYGEYERCRKSDSTRSRPYPPPPPLVRVGAREPKSIYPYIPASSNPWLARILEPDWLQEENRAVLRTPDGPENLSRSEAWGATNASSAVREPTPYEQQNNAHVGSPRLVAGPPPHYPTPPQSSPLQPLSLADCVGITDLYATRSTPNGLLDLCSPPPSPDARTALLGSPRGLSNSSGYQPHVTRLVQVDARYVVAVNVEPHKYNSLLAVPVCDVVNKFLRGTSVQSCQIVLETVFGLHLYECNSFQQEAFSKHNLSIFPGSKLVSLSDLKNCLYQLKCLLVEQSGASELAKRWRGSAREC